MKGQSPVALRWYSKARLGPLLEHPLRSLLEYLGQGVYSKIPRLDSDNRRQQKIKGNMRGEGSGDSSRRGERGV